LEELMPDADDWRIDHIGVGVSNIGKSRKLYGAALGALGLRAIMHITKTFEITDSANDSELGGVGYGANYPIFWIDVFHTPDAKQHIAFRARSREEVQAFHSAALSAGGRDNGGPGLRTGGYPQGYYAAFVLDPDGNNIEAVFREG
jgi:catechol 2,3-dioxygenase-like lactoylglutathione lyase family enzyme